MQLPLAYLDAAVVEEVPVDLWRQLFDEVGWPATLASRRQDFGHADVLAAFEQDTPSDELLQALETLHVLGTETGCEAIVTAMQDRCVSRDVLPPDASERELALHLFLAQRNDASLADVFARAQTQAQEQGGYRCYHEFVGRAAHAVTDLAAKGDALRDATLHYCRDRGLGDHVQVRVFEDDGAYVVHIIRSHHTRKPLAVIPGRSARATIEYRPVHGDILRYDAAVGRLRIAARSSSVVAFYRRVLGQVFFDDADFFTGDAVCSLRVLQEQGREALERHGILGIGRVWMTECVWERGDRDLLHIRSTDCFRHIEELRLPLTEGELIQAKLKVAVTGKSTRPVTVNIRAPSRIEVSQRHHEQLIDRFLTRIGIRNGKGPTAESDLWSLYPWRHSGAVWRTLFGRETDVLVERGVLSPIRLDAVHSADQPGAGRVLQAHEISDGEFYGVSMAPEIPSQSLTATDLDGLKLNPEQLRQELRSRLRIAGPATPWSEQEDFLDLGIVELGDYRLRLSYALRPPRNGIGDRLRTRAGGERWALLVPSQSYSASELPAAVLEDPLPSREQAIRVAIAAAGLADVVPAVFTAPDGARLVIDTRRGIVWVDGIEITDMKQGTHPFRFVERLARYSAIAVSTRDLTAELSGARDDGNTAARQAKAAARRLIREALAQAGRSCEEDFFPVSGTGAYRCAIVSYVV